MTWADAHGIGHLGWTWNTWDCSKGPALISDDAGTPTAFGGGGRLDQPFTAPCMMPPMICLPKMMNTINSGRVATAVPANTWDMSFQ
jgi:hypothetical protein